MSGTWTERMAMLKAHKERYGTCDLTRAPWLSVDSLLRNFVTESRKQYKRFQRGERSTLTAARIGELRGMGFDFCPLESGGARENHERRYRRKWDEKFAELEAYRAEHGDCLVSTVSGVHSKLGEWVRSQRKLMKKFGREGFNPDRLARLEGIGFDFDPVASGSYVAKKRADRFPQVDANWERHFNDLVRFKEEHGHIIVGPNSEDWPGLYDWIHGQRKEYKRREAGDRKALMYDKWVTKLNELKFDWAPMKGARFAKMLSERRSEQLDRLWMKRYGDLRTFQQKNGHYNTPDKTLKVWVYYQRKYKRQSDQGEKTPLTEARARLLNELGFDWSNTASAKNR